jgi:hypothetical protein
VHCLVKTAPTIAALPVFIKTIKILQKIANLSDLLGEYHRELIPFVVKILDSTEVTDVRRDALWCFYILQVLMLVEKTKYFFGLV